MDRLPHFIVVGPPRTATTWLDKALRGPVGLPSSTKETHFFSRNYKRGIAWYGRHFADIPRDVPIGEICASYFENPDSPRRISNHIPDCRIICTLRDPVERLYSYYKLIRHNGKTSLGFEELIYSHPKYLEFSQYGTLVRRWKDRFGDHNVLVVLNDDMASDPQEYIDGITRFIGIPRIVLPQSQISNDRQNTIETAPRSELLARTARGLRNWLGANQLYSVRKTLDRAGVWRFCFEGGDAFPALDSGIRSRLVDALGPEIEELEVLIQRDLSKWKSKPA